MKYLITILLVLELLGCESNQSFLCVDIDNNYRKILKLSEEEFKNTLRIEFKNDNDLKNLKEYLISITKGEIELLKPSEELTTKIKKQNIIGDIWNADKSINLKGKFIKCIRKKKSRFLREYYSRIEDIGDLAPKLIARGMIKYIEENRIDENGLDENIYLIATVNFYLITIN